jgi:outer membrane protein OmpA-like peptidoglycan-associated protein
MKRLLSVLASSGPLIAAVLITGCASKQPPQELLNARAAYSRAQSGPTSQVNRAGVIEAQQALNTAERQFKDHPGSDDVKVLSYVAERKAQTAEADGRTAIARQQQEQAERAALQMQAMQAEKEAAKQQQVAAVSERRAKVALDRLGLAAKDDARGTVITLPSTSMFATNKTVILPGAKGRLMEIAKGVKEVMAEGAPQDVGRRITLIGFTDSTGSDDHNMDLSKKRAEAVKVFFSQQGLDPSMMDAEGHGEADPIADNGTKEGRAENRRVEVVISPAANENRMQPQQQMQQPQPQP